MTETIPSDPFITPRRAATALVAMIVGVALLCGASLLLPHDPYIRYQQLASGDVSRIRWVYERIHFDPTPIDVAIVGSSRTEAAVSAPSLEKTLTERLGRPIHVANLAVPMEGRNLHYSVAKDLLAARPETRLVILSLVEPIKRSHPAFRNVGDVEDVLGSPLWINFYWLEDVAFLPYRQLSLFITSAFPEMFGFSREFRPEAYRGTGFDTTHTFRLDNGTVVDRDRITPEATLLRQVAERPASGGGASLPARILGGDENVVENRMTARLARETGARCTRLVLLHLPTFLGRVEDIDLVTNRRVAPVLLTPPSIGAHWSEFSDAGHLRRSGIDKVSAWLPGALAPYLGPLRKPPVCGAAASGD